MIFKIFLIIFCLFLPFAAQGASLIDINTAPSEELEKIIGIGPVLAQRTIEARPFNSLDDLIKVKGIGEITLQKIKDQGLAWVGLQEELEPKPVGSSDPTAPSDDGAEPKSEQKSVEGEPLPIYPKGVVFSEILPSPEGPDAENEWIEIFNQNNFEVDLSEWKIKDKEGKITTYTFSAGAKISALRYLVLKRPETKITLNNSGEGLELINPNGEIADSITFGKASLGQSYNGTQSGWAWSITLTPGAKNVVPAPQSSEQKSQEKKSEDGPLTAEFLAGKGTEKVAKPLTFLEKVRGKSSNYALFIAFAAAIFSAIIILILKKKISPKPPF